MPRKYVCNKQMDHPFRYRWGQTVARFDDEKVEVKPGSVEMKTGNDF